MRINTERACVTSKNFNTKEVKIMGESVKKSGGWRTNKWVRAAIPALLLHCSIGTVYC